MAALLVFVLICARLLASQSCAPLTRRAAQSKKSSILDLRKYVDERVLVKFAGGREGALLIARDFDRR